MTGDAVDIRRRRFLQSLMASAAAVVLPISRPAFATDFLRMRAIPSRK